MEQTSAHVAVRLGRASAAAAYRRPDAPGAHARFGPEAPCGSTAACMDEGRVQRDLESTWVVTRLERLNNRAVRAALRRGSGPGRSRRWRRVAGVRGCRGTLVSNSLDGDIFLPVAAHGRQADYVSQPRGRAAGQDQRAVAGGDRRAAAGRRPSRPSRALPHRWDALSQGTYLLARDGRLRRTARDARLCRWSVCRVSA